MKRSFMVDSLRVVVCDSREEMGCAVASDGAAFMRHVLAKTQEMSAIFAAAPSQNEAAKTNDIADDEANDLVEAINDAPQSAPAEDAPQSAPTEDTSDAEVEDLLKDLDLD